MIRFVIKRIFLIIPIMLCVAVIIFAIVNATPGDIARNILGSEAPPEAIEQLNHELGLDKPFIYRLFKYIWDALHGDFGTSYRTGRPVVTEVASRFPVSLKLSVYGIIFAIVLGVPLGILSAVKQYSLLDSISTVTALFFAAIPPFWLGLMMIFYFSLVRGWLPPNGTTSFKNFIMPTVSVGLPVAAEILRMTRSAMLEAIRQDYVRTARAKGLKEPVVITRHALGNALLPVITQIGISFGLLFGSCVVSEAVYVIPGVGTLIMNAVKSKDIPLVMGSILWLSFVFCIVMLIVDILYAFADPRVKAKYK